MSKKFILLLFIFTCTISVAQTTYKVNNVRYQSQELDKKFKDYDIVELNIEKIARDLKQSPRQHFLELVLPDYKLEANMFQYNVRAANYFSSIATNEGIVKKTKKEIVTYRGLDSKNRVITMMATGEHFIAMFDRGDHQLYFESLSYFDKDAPKNHCIVYTTDNVIPSKDKKCAFDERVHRLEEIQEQTKDKNATQKAGQCWLFEIAVANDFLMHQRFGSASAVESRNEDLINEVTLLYSNGQFSDDYEFIIATQFTSTCNTCDPWTSSTDAGSLLNSFTSWAQGGGFGGAHDVGGLWTARNLNGGTIGLAWVGTACGSNKYHICQDFGGSDVEHRNLWAHEIGHNYDASHTNGFWIMAPSLNTADMWASLSIAEIDSYVDGWEGSSCPSSCGSGAEPPEAFFTSDIQEGCIPFQVQFENLSTGTISDFEWTFDGGTPSTSTEENPTVTYETSGQFDVELRVIGPAGEDVLMESFYITAKEEPEADFNSDADGRIVEFLNTSTGEPDFYEWDFGDGNFSTLKDPVHEYAKDSIYTVTLSVENDCGFSSISKEVEVISPVEAEFTAPITTICVGDTLRFQDLSSDNVDSYKWEFDGAFPATIFDQNPLVQYDIPGVFEVELTVYSINGVHTDTETKTAYITVLEAPTAEFNYMMDSVNNLLYHFTNISRGMGDYEWDFGDGTMSTDSNPSHEYQMGGIYDVSLRASNICDESEYFDVIEISSRPSSDFDSDSKEICIKDMVQFTDESTGGVDSLRWFFEGGIPNQSTQSMPTVEYSREGSYDVRLITYNEFGSDTMIRQNYITVNANPTSAFTFDDMNDGLFQFTSNSMNGDSLIWNFGDGDSSNIDNPVHQFMEDGSYQVVLTVFNDCDVVSSNQTIQVLRIPEAIIETNPLNEVCQKDSAVLSGVSSIGQIDDYQWIITGPDSAAFNTPVILLPTDKSGSYNIELVVSNAAGSDTSTLLSYTVLPLPISDYSYIQDSLDFEFTDQASHSDSVQWNLGDGTIVLNDTVVNHSYSSAGSYSVTLYSFNSCGVDSSVQEIFISGASPLSQFSSDKIEVCVGDSVQFFDDSFGEPNQWLWSLEGGIPSTSVIQSPFVTYSQPGTYDVELISMNDFGADTLTVEDYITVIGAPNISLEVDSMDNVYSFSVNYVGLVDSIAWDFGDGTTILGDTVSHTYISNGVYVVTLTIFNECGSYDFTRSVNVQSLSSIENGILDFKVYPNPAKEILIIDGVQALDLNYSDLQLWNIFGQEIEVPMYRENERLIKLDIHTLKSGAYFLSINQGEQKIMRKIIID